MQTQGMSYIAIHIKKFLFYNMRTEQIIYFMTNTFISIKNLNIQDTFCANKRKVLINAYEWIQNEIVFNLQVKYM